MLSKESSLIFNSCSADQGIRDLSPCIPMPKTHSPCKSATRREWLNVEHVDAFDPVRKPANPFGRSTGDSCIHAAGWSRADVVSIDCGEYSSIDDVATSTVWMVFCCCYFGGRKMWSLESRQVSSLAIPHRPCFSVLWWSTSTTRFSILRHACSVRCQAVPFSAFSAIDTRRTNGARPDWWLFAISQDFSCRQRKKEWAAWLPITSACLNTELVLGSDQTWWPLQFLRPRARNRFVRGKHLGRATRNRTRKLMLHPSFETGYWNLKWNCLYFLRISDCYFLINFNSPYLRSMPIVNISVGQGIMLVFYEMFRFMKVPPFNIISPTTTSAHTG